MKVVNQFGHQGDTQWYGIDKIPKSAVKVDKQFIAASERSGNAHGLCGNYEMFEYEGGHVINCIEDCTLNHTGLDMLKGNWDNSIVLPKRDHESSTITKGIYFVGIQQRFDPLEGQKRKTKD
jgi:hypothetical protein